LNDEALVNFAHASYKKVRDVAVEVMKRSYGQGPEKLYFFGSSEGGREGLTMAQRYPQDFDGIFSRVPVIHWTGLQHTGLRDGMALMNGGWLPPAQVQLVGKAVLAACDAADGLVDGIVSDPVGCRQRFDVRKLQCESAAADTCLTAPQVKAVQTLNAPLRLDVELANGLTEYPGRGPSGEALAALGPTGGWMAWWTGATAPSLPPQPSNGIGWFYGAGAIQYFYARNPSLDVSTYHMRDHAARVKEISALMDSTHPDLSAFHARGGKLIMMENMADYAQSPYAGIGYYESVIQKMGADTSATFIRLYTAPSVDHVGSGAPANVDMLGALSDWVERGRPPGTLELLEQSVSLPVQRLRARPLCQWPLVPRYQSGDVNNAASFKCSP
jgi:feruloyl esterase